MMIMVHKKKLKIVYFADRGIYIKEKGKLQRIYVDDNLAGRWG